MKKVVSDAQLNSKIFIDSAGILDYHEGEQADRRMQTHAVKRGYDLTSISRPVLPEDFTRFDYIVAMDEDNVSALKSFNVDSVLKNKIVKMTSFNGDSYNYNSVPDPYYGGPEGFELVLDLLEDACKNFLDHLVRNNPELK
ncbi:MAG: phosphotyrosine protein phosphatase [Melioribacteraceae bacterium]|nr:MAG: phosphotyrosine protein phosphatase [Melioribacteraceae bacterium]